MNNLHKTSAINRFQQYIVGDFDNQAQVEQERVLGIQTHPFARHINRIADAKIRNAPRRNGFWLIEESYYTYPDGSEKINHHLFFFEDVHEGTVRLYAYQLPESLPMSDLTNANTALSIDFDALCISPKFQPAQYAFNGEEFTLNAVNDWGEGITFSLIETISDGHLSVMELVEKNGKSLMAYQTPIEYERK